MPYGGGVGGNVDPQAPEKEAPKPKPAAPPEPLVNNPHPMGYDTMAPLIDALRQKTGLGFGFGQVTPQGLQMPSQYSILQPPPGLPTVGYEGPMMLPPPPQAGMPRP